MVSLNAYSLIVHKVQTETSEQPHQVITFTERLAVDRLFCHHSTTMTHVAVLVSGGVDSSLALHEAYHQYKGRADAQVTAYYLKIWLEDDASFLGECPWEEDLSYARQVCDHVGVPLKVIPLQEEYYREVVSYTLTELKAGHTPSPDIFCNQRIKFGAFYRAVVADIGDGQDICIVTGHYGDIHRDPSGDAQLFKAPDPVKDQTYFLSHLRQEQLQRAYFPLGTLTKDEVRRRAAAINLPTRNRPDSQGICFLGRIRYRDFVAHYLGEKPGEIREYQSETLLGEHKGAWFYTIGQRQGLGLGNGPWYVTDRSIARNIVWVSHGLQGELLARHVFTVDNVHTLSPAGVSEWYRIPNLHVKLRHGPDLIPAGIAPVDESSLEVTLARGDRGIAAGQFAVFYAPPRCLGAGRICRSLPEAGNH